MLPRLSRVHHAAALLVTLVATVAVVAWAMLEQASDYQGADTAIHAVADAQDVQRQIHDLQHERGTAVLRVAAAGGAPRAAEFEDYTDRIALLGQRITGFDRIGDPALHEGLRALEKLGYVKEATAQQRGLLTGVFAVGVFTPQEYSRFIAMRATQQDRLTDFDRLATNDQRSRLRAVLDSPTATEAARYVTAAVIGAGGRLPHPVDATAWWTVMTAVINELRAAQQAVADDITRQAQQLRRAALRDLVLCLMLGAAGSGAQIALFIRHGRRTRHLGAADTLVAEIGTTQVDGGAADDAWYVLAQRVAEQFRAHVLILRLGGGTRRFRAWTRFGSDELERLRPTIETSCVADVLSAGAPVVVDSLGEHLLVSDSSLGPAAAVPVRAGARVLGVLFAARDREAARFTTGQVDELVALTDHAAVAVDLAEAQEAQRRSALIDDRARIAHGLYHDVIYRLVSLGISLQGVLGLITHPRVRGRVDRVIGQLDETVRQLRVVVFDLQPSEPECTLRQRLLDAAVELVEGTDITLMVNMSKTVDTLRQPELAEELEAMVRTAVGNVVQHAQATELALTIEVTDLLSIEVCDNGVGFSAATARGGLSDLEQRAAKLGGVLSTVTDPADGTHVTWHIPLKPEHLS